MDDTGGILKTSDLNPNTLPNVANLILDTDDRTVTLLKNFGHKKNPTISDEVNWGKSKLKKIRKFEVFVFFFYENYEHHR
jgi:hypothetical protein